MPPSTVTLRLLPSVFDRLTDPESMGGPSTLVGYTEREMLRAVRADVEELLNTRQVADGTRPARDPVTGEPLVDPRTRQPAREVFPEVANSIVCYGLPDLVSYGGAASHQYAALAKTVAEVIARNEPRLKNVKVTVTPAANNDPRSVRFHIDAELNLDPAPEVGFVTVLELTTGRATVKTDGDGA